MCETVIKFLNIYENVNCLCHSCIKRENGITEYINAMYEEKSPLKKDIKDWGVTLYTLKKIKSLKDQINHSEIYNPDISTITFYIDWLYSFENKLFMQKDPVALLNERKKEFVLKEKSIIKKPKKAGIFFYSKNDINKSNRQKEKAQIRTIAFIISTFCAISITFQSVIKFKLSKKFKTFTH